MRSTEGSTGRRRVRWSRPSTSGEVDLVLLDDVEGALKSFFNAFLGYGERVDVLWEAAFSVLGLEIERTPKTSILSYNVVRRPTHNGIMAVSLSYPTRCSEVRIDEGPNVLEGSAGRYSMSLRIMGTSHHNDQSGCRPAPSNISSMVAKSGRLPISWTTPRSNPPQHVALEMIGSSRPRWPIWHPDEAGSEVERTPRTQNLRPDKRCGAQKVIPVWHRNDQLW